MVKLCAGPEKLPFGVLTLRLATSVRILSIDSPYAASVRGFTASFTAGWLPPLNATRPTPGISEIFDASRAFASVSKSVSRNVFDVTASVMIGASAGLILA